MLENNLILKILQKEFSLLLRFLLPYYGFIVQFFETVKPWLFAFIALSAICWTIYWLIKIYLTWTESKKPATLFEVSPPTLTEQSSYTTTQLFSSVHGLLRQKSWMYRLLDVSKSYSFEIVSSKDKGIRYILRVSADDASIVKKNLIAYLPGIQVKETNDYLKPNSQVGHVIEIKATNHFAFPLKKQDNLKEYDPIAYITGSMTKLTEDELVAVQVIILPTSDNTSQIVGKLRGLFLANKDVLSELKGGSPVGSIFASVIYVILQIPYWQGTSVTLENNWCEHTPVGFGSPETGGDGQSCTRQAS